MYHCAFVSLKTITVSSLKINIKTLKALASFAIFTTSKKIIANAISVEVVKSDSPVETISEISASYDLLILGTPEKDNWIKVLFGGGKDKFTERAACSVLRITLKD